MDVTKKQCQKVPEIKAMVFGPADAWWFLKSVSSAGFSLQPPFAFAGLWPWLKS